MKRLFIQAAMEERLLFFSTILVPLFPMDVLIIPCLVVFELL
jgi:hypothetical protein